MQSFLKNERVEPKKKSVLERIKNFHEIYERFDTAIARQQADRCVQCGIPYCHNGCPLDNYIPQWLKLTSMGDLECAFEMSNESSPFPEIMGRICPQDKLCEGACTLNKDYGAITIGAVETFITEEGFKNGLRVEFPPIDATKKVAVIGAGPAGLSVATFLLRKGIGVDIYEKEAFAGGLLMWGIPDFKLNKETVKRRIKLLEEAGAQFYFNHTIEDKTAFDELRGRYAAVFLGFGAKKGNSTSVPGEQLENVYEAMDFLGSAQKRSLELPQIRSIDVKGKNIVVIGGGDTAMDCVRTAIREGAHSVICAYRRGEAGMPGSKKEYKNAVEEGVEFRFFVAPKEIIGDKTVKALKIVKTEIEQGGKRGKLIEVAGTDELINADMVVLALGFSVEAPAFVKESGIEFDDRGNIAVDASGKTSLDGVFAGGDCSRGANLVVNAALDGRVCAQTIAKILGKE